MIVGVYGIGYLVAAGNSRKHWLIVLVGLLGKVFGSIRFVVTLLSGTFPPLFGLTILTNDLVWWIPFVMILQDAAKHGHTGSHPAVGTPLRFVKESTIKATPDIVFRFYESPGALVHLIPPWEKMEVVESAGSLEPGSRVVLLGRVGPIPIRWEAIHTEYDPPHLFADRQESGPFSKWYHRYCFNDDGHGGTILRDEVEYALPLGCVGRWLGGGIIRQKLDQMFEYRHETTRRLIESGEWISTPTVPKSS